MAILAMVGWISWGIFGAVVVGLVAGVLIGQFTEYYTSDEYRPTREIAEQAQMGSGTVIITGFANGMMSSALPVVTIAACIIAAYAFAGGFTDMALGLYGIGFAAVGMLATLGITLSTDTYGPIADNAGGNAEMSGLGPEIRKKPTRSTRLATQPLHQASIATQVLASMGMDPLKAVLAPSVVAGLGTVLSIFGIFLVRCKEDASQKNLLRALLTGTLTSSVLVVVAMAVLAWVGWISWGIFGAVVVGLVAGVLIGQFTEYYTSDEYRPTREIAEQAQMGSGTVIITGFANGMMSSALPVVTIAACIIAAYAFAGGFTDMALGLYGIGFAAVGMLATLGITLSTDTYGPIADNAGGNAEMSGLGPEIRKKTDALDSLGNTTAATGKGFAIGSAALTALALIAANIEEIRIWISRLAFESPDGVYKVGKVLFSSPGRQVEGTVNVATAHISDFLAAYELTIMNPRLLAGIFIGCMMAFLFCAMAMKAVGRNAGRIVEEVRRQFREMPGIMDRQNETRLRSLRLHSNSRCTKRDDSAVAVGDYRAGSRWYSNRHPRCHRTSDGRYGVRLCPRSNA